MEFTGFLHVSYPAPPFCEAMLQVDEKWDRTGFRAREVNSWCPQLMLKILHDTPTHKSAEINQSYLIAFICILQETFDVFVFLFPGNLLVPRFHLYNFSGGRRSVLYWQPLWLTLTDTNYGIVVFPVATWHRLSKNWHSHVCWMKAIPHDLLLALSANVNYQRKGFYSKIINSSCLGHTNLRDIISEGW